MTFEKKIIRLFKTIHCGFFNTNYRSDAENDLPKKKMLFFFWLLGINFSLG